VGAAQPESAWGKVNSGLPMPFPPPRESNTPLPAPTAQRGRSNLPEALNVDTRSRSETPELTATTPSLAPWAKEPVDAPKGPSLKEIQEAEAKKMAKAEEIAAANRRAQLEQEMKLLASQPVAPAPGLPTSSTWGSSVSPATPTSAPLAWAKPATNAQPVSASKKTLADIQREEELRKQKIAAQTAQHLPELLVASAMQIWQASRPRPFNPLVVPPGLQLERVEKSRYQQVHLPQLPKLFGRSVMQTLPRRRPLVPHVQHLPFAALRQLDRAISMLLTRSSPNGLRES
jgi:hypothetical protein